MFFPTLELIATTDVILIDIHKTINNALQKMHEHNHRSIVIVNGSLYYIITSKDLIRLKVEGVDFATPLVQIDLRPLPLLEKGSNVVNALNQDHAMDEHICVCNEDGTLYGLVTNSDIVASVDPQVVLESLQIGTVFDKKYGYKSFEYTTKMDQVLGYMKDAPIDCVIIQHDNKPVGIITSKDIIKFINNATCLTAEVGTVMSSPIETMPSSASISEALDFLKQRHYKRIVVVEETGAILGIVTQQDIISRTYLKWSQLVNEHFLQFTELTQILEQKNQYLANLATKDALTRISNRHMFTEQFAKECATAKRYKTNLSMLIMDLDHFKEVNDTYGHNVGDYVLKRFASIVSELIREADIFARWGGEEFVLLLRHTSCMEAYTVAEKIRQAVDAYHFDDAGKISCSIGVTNIQEDDVLETAIERADQALYVAKHQGRNRTIACASCSQN